MRYSRLDSDSANSRHQRTCAQGRILQPNPVRSLLYRMLHSSPRYHPACVRRIRYGQLLATRLLEGLDNLKHARARARSQVEDRNTAARAVFGHGTFDATQPDRFTGADFATHEIERFHVPARKIDHMNVVAHARAVGSRIIVAEDLDAFELARGNLRHIGKQVVRDALRVFADPAAFMRTDRVEVTQQHHIPLRIRTVQIGKDALEHGFGLAIRIGGLVLGTIFGDRNHLGVAIDGRAAREDDVLHIMVARYIEQCERTGNVVPIVFERLLGRFAHRFKACEVDDRIDVVRSEYLGRAASRSRIST